jgi:hypothetical protein
MKVFDDLDIRVVDWFADFEFRAGNLVKRRGEFVGSTEKRFSISIRIGLKEETTIDVIVHELGHYHLTKVLLSMKIPTIIGLNYPDWIVHDAHVDDLKALKT